MTLISNPLIATPKNFDPGIVSIRFSKTDDSAKSPEESPDGLLHNIFCLESFVVGSGRTKGVHTGISLWVPKYIEAHIRPIDSMARKGMICPTGVKVIHCGQMDEIIVYLTNISPSNRTFAKHEPIAEISFVCVKKPEFIEM